MNAEYPLTVLHRACCSLKPLHRPQERGATMWPYFFKQLQSFVGELESAVQGEAMPFLLESSETVSTWTYKLI